jgi:tripartite-type tricarboxylate transporter receptor subunit TctC
MSMQTVFARFKRATLFPLLLCALSLQTPLALPARAAEFPAKPVRIILPYPPGSGTDAFARVLAAQLTEQLGQSFVVENRPGANGVIGIDYVIKSPADGYTLLFTPNSPIVASPHLYPATYDVRKDLDPVAMVATGNFIMVGHASVSFKNLNEFIAAAKAAPGKITFASAGAGSQAHLNYEMLKAGAGIDCLHVPYKGGGPATIDLLGGQVQLFFESLPIMLPHVRAGKLRAFGVTSPQRSPFLPEVPSISEQVKGFDVRIANPWYGAFAPSNMPEAVLAKLNAEFHKAVQDPAMQRRLPEGGFIAAPTTTPNQFREFVRVNHDLFGNTIRALNIKVD